MSAPVDNTISSPTVATAAQSEVLAVADSTMAGPSATESLVSDFEGSDTAADSTTSSVAGDEDRVRATQASNLRNAWVDLQIVPWTSGSAYTQSTKPEDFEDWIEYISFCKDGPKMRFLCIDPYVDEPKSGAYNIMDVSKKLWADHGEYFAAICANRFRETVDGQVQIVFDDIAKFDMVFLQLFLEAGPIPCGRPHVGAESKIMQRLARAYELADRFKMRDVKPKLAAYANDIMRADSSGPLTGWRAAYLREAETVDYANPDPGPAKQHHEDKFVDYNDAFVKCRSLPRYARVVDPQEIVHLILNHAPKILLARTCKDIDGDRSNRLVISEDFKDTLFWTMTLNKNA